MKITIDLMSNPTMTSQAKGINFKTGTVYTKNTIKEQKAEYRFALLSQLTKQGIRPPHFKGCVKLTLCFGFYTADHKRWGKLKQTKPDADNTAKVLIDVLADIGFFAVGDQQVSILTVYKSWAEKPFVSIDAEEVKDDIYRL